MSNLNKKCKLCFSYNKTEDFELIQDTTIYILNSLSIKLILENLCEVLCSSCSRQMLAAFKFKSNYISDTVLSHVDLEHPTQVDLRDIYVKIRDDDNAIMFPEDEKICRLCMELTGKMFVPIFESEMELLRIFLPEINVAIVKDPVLCKSCFDSLLTHSRFLENCSNIQNGKPISSNPQKVNIKDDPLLEGPMKMEEVDVKCEVESAMNYFIKSETIDVDDVRSDQTSVKIEQSEEAITDNQSRDELPSHENVWSETTETDRHESDDIDPGGETKYRYNRVLIQKDATQVQMHSCGVCEYATEGKQKLKRHQLIHKDSSQVPMHKCDVCDYETKFKHHLKKHELIHKETSEVQMYTCGDCDYETKYKSCLKKHELLHKDPSQLEMHKCDVCGYKTKFKHYMKNHLVLHKDSSQLQMYKCSDCNYEAKFKSSLKKHQIIHKDPSQVRMHKCDVCGYETKFKSSLNKHQLLHKDPSQLQMYKCGVCGYETKFKLYMKNHLIIHKDSSQVQMHKCGDCNYETKFKGNIKNHQFTKIRPNCECTNVKYVTTKQSSGTTLKSTVATKRHVVRKSEFNIHVCETNVRMHIYKT